MAAKTLQTAKPKMLVIQTPNDPLLALRARIAHADSAKNPIRGVLRYESREQVTATGTKRSPRKEAVTADGKHITLILRSEAAFGSSSPGELRLATVKAKELLRKVSEALNVRWNVQLRPSARGFFRLKVHGLDADKARDCSNFCDRVSPAFSDLLRT